MTAETSGPTSERFPSTVLRCLRGIVTLQCVGAFWQSRVGETAIFEWLWLGVRLSESTALAVADAGAYVVLAAGVASLVAPLGPWLYVVVAWFLATAMAETLLGGAAFTALTLPADAVRIMAPLLLVWWPEETETAPPLLSSDRLDQLLGLAVASTFAAHGWEAFQLHPRFADYLFVASEMVGGERFSTSTAHGLLIVIGIVDWLVALAVLAGMRWRPLLLYMTFWGTLTALARVVHGGWWGIPKCLVRAANAGVPLALYLWSRARQPYDEA